MTAGIGVLGILAWLIAVAAGITTLVCFILILVKMFQAEMTGLAIASLILAFCTGIGVFIAFVVGWVKSDEWRVKHIMLIWTVAIVAEVLSTVLLFATAFTLTETRMMQDMEPQVIRVNE